MIQGLLTLKGTLLVQRWKRTDQMKIIASQKYEQLVSSLSGNWYGVCYNNSELDSNICCLLGIVSVTEETVQHWIENEKSVITSKDVHCPVADWRTTYFLMVQSYFLIRYYNYVT